MSDLIRREDAKEAVACELHYKLDIDIETAKGVASVIDALPSAEAEIKCVAQIDVDTEEVVRRIKEECNITDRWIPCSERLPSEYGEYLATVDGETIEVTYVPEIKGLVEGWSTCDAHGYKILSDDDVIAWQPLPTPYKESEVEE